MLSDAPESDVIAATPPAAKRRGGLRILSVTLRNFMSTGKVTQPIDLAAAPLTLLMGQNLDTAQGESSSRNGAGKSVLTNAIAYGLFGVPLDKIKVDNLINNINGKEMSVSVTFEKDGRRYRIERGRKPTYFRFLIDGEKVEDRRSDETQGEGRDTQEEINRILGLTPTMFPHIIGLNTSTEPFLKLAAAKQREVIEELLGITELSRKAEVLKEAIRTAKEEVRMREFEIKTQADHNARIEAALAEVVAKQKTWNRQHAERIASLEQALASLQNIDFEAELAVFERIDEWSQQIASLEAVERETALMVQTRDAESTALLEEADLLRQKARLKRQEKRDPVREVDLLRRLIRPFDDAPVKRRVAADRTRYQSEIEATDRELTRLAGEVERFEAVLAAPGDLTCTTCGQSLRDGDHRDHIVSRVTQDRDAALARLCTLVQTRTRLDEAIQGLEAEQARTVVLAEQAEAENRRLSHEADTLAAKIAKDNKRLEAEAVALERKAAAKGDQSDRIIEAAETEEDEQRDLIAQARAALGPCPTSLFKTRDDIWKARSTYDRYAQDLEAERLLTNPHDDAVAHWRGSLTEIDYTRINDLTRLRLHQDTLLKLLTDKGSVIRKRLIDQNLAFLNARLTIHLATVGLPHSVRILSDLSVEITHFGKGLDYDNFSKGEKNRLILSLCWSFRDIFENLKHPVNLMMIDELADSGMDSLGVELAFDAVRKMAYERSRNILLLSNREELIPRCEATLLARKEDRFTSYETDGVIT